MGGASAAASARQRNKKNTRSSSAGGNNNFSDDRLGASLSSLNGRSDVDIDASWRSRNGRMSTPKRADREHSSSLHSSGIDLDEKNEDDGNDMKNILSQGQDSFNENDATSQKSSIELPPWLHSLNNGRKYIGEKVNDHRVQNSILLLIVINSIMMGIATFPFVKDNPDVSYKFDLVDQIFLIIFTIESALQLLYYGWYLFKDDGFLVFDLLIVIMSWALEGTQVIRAFRIFRALRLITRVEVMRNLVMALFSVIPKMTAIALLLMLIFYIFGVMMTTLFKGMYPGPLNQPYFESLFYSLFTLFQMMTLVSAMSGICFLSRRSNFVLVAHRTFILLYTSSFRMNGQIFWAKCKKFIPGHGHLSSFLLSSLGLWL